MVEMAQQQIVKLPRVPRKPQSLDLRTPSGRILPY